MTAKARAALAVSVGAIRELIGEALRARPADARTAKALDLAVDALDALWSALESKDQDDTRREQDRCDFFEFAPACCVLTDVNGRVRCANRAAAELLGVLAEEMEHRPLAAFFGPHQQALMPAYLLDLLAHGTQPAAIRWCAALSGPGGSVPVEVSVRETGRNQGRLSGLCWMIRPLGGSPAVAPQTAASTGAPRLDLPVPPQTPK